MIEIAPNWQLYVDVGPEWLFFRLGTSARNADTSPPLAERVWSIAEDNRIYRFVIELEPQVALTSHLVGQFVLLHKRSHQSGGVMRLCGLADANYQVLKIMQLHDRFPNYPTRNDAVMGYVPVAH